jgi:hypothetical protein
MKFTESLEGFMEAQLKFLQRQDRGRPIPANHEQRTSNMTSESENNLPVVADDGFDEADVDSNRIIQGTIIRCVDGVWSDADGMSLAPETTMLALGTTMCLQRWKDQLPVETIRKVLDEPLPDVEELNEKMSKEEWELGLDGEPRPPWQLQHVVYLLNPSDAAVFTYINSTVGASIAVDRLKSKVMWMRQLRGTHVVPLVKFDAKPMKTRFGKKLRPEFTILEWRQLGHVDVKGASATARVEHQSAALQPVELPSLKEEINDEIPHLG